MNVGKYFYIELFGKAFVPKKLRPYLRNYFLKAGYDDVSYAIFGWLFWISTLLTMFLYVPFIYPEIREVHPIGFFIYTVLGWAVPQLLIVSFLSFVVYMHLNLRVYRRTKVLEQKLPDYLNLVSVNLKGGMSFENALWSAIKPEFDVLAKEITIVSKSVMTGNDVKESLYQFADKYDSPILKRTVDLLVGEVEGGGRIVEVIDSIVEDLKKAGVLKRELRVASTTYMIFITMIVMVIAPALFAVAYQLLIMITKFTATLGTSIGSSGSLGSLPFQIGASQVSPGQFKKFSYISLGIISTFSAMIVSIIDRGDIKGGLKYVPAFLSGSVIFYFIFSMVMEVIFSGFTP